MTALRDGTVWKGCCWVAVLPGTRGRGRPPLLPPAAAAASPRLYHTLGPSPDTEPALLQQDLPMGGVASVCRPTIWAGPRPSRKSLNWLSAPSRVGKINLQRDIGHVRSQVGWAGADAEAFHLGSWVCFSSLQCNYTILSGSEHLSFLHTEEKKNTSGCAFQTVPLCTSG